MARTRSGALRTFTFAFVCMSALCFVGVSSCQDENFTLRIVPPPPPSPTPAASFTPNPIAIDLVVPARAPTSQDSYLTIFGTGFLPTTLTVPPSPIPILAAASPLPITIGIGGIECTPLVNGAYLRVTDTTIYCGIKAASSPSPGPVQVAVTNTTNGAAQTPLNSFTFIAPPTIASVNGTTTTYVPIPSVGLSSLVIAGSNFISPVVVTIGVDGASCNVTNITSTQIVCNINGGSRGLTLPVVVKNSDGQTALSTSVNSNLLISFTN